VAETGSGEKLKVFISYSRRDSSEFADELVDGLELAGFAPFLDRHDIAAGEKWEDRLGGLIAQADTVVFVISPEAVESERCAWEVERALAQSKRLLPVVYKSVPDGDIPETLRERQFIRFDAGPTITRPLRELAQALRYNIDWIREHTRLGELATRWEARGRPESLLLRGEDVASAQSWAERRKPHAPGFTDAMRAFIAASKDADTAFRLKADAAEQRVVRSRRLVAVATAAFVVLLITGLAAWRQQDWLRESVYVWRNVHALAAAQERALKPGDPPFKECTDCPEMVVVPAGSFLMGSPEGQGNDTQYPQHNVTIKSPFAVSKFELRFAEWDVCAAHRGCAADISDGGWGRGQRPVINVNLDDARHYVAWLTKVTGQPYRLLSEAEYEYATRAGTQTAYPWGNDVGKNNANCYGCGSEWDGYQTAPVGSFAPNQFGLYDMVGNVFEWVTDCTHSNYNGAPADGSAWYDGNCIVTVVRGGSWGTSPDGLRSAHRGFGAPSVRRSDLGFRVVRTLSY
jgi:formylglycine-generating enzyme required for sulfatase activity